MTDTEQLIEEQFKRLPAEMRQALNTIPWKSSVKEIALLNKMTFEQVEIVERETMFVLYGFENPEDYISNLMREAQIDEPTATSIATAVDEKIFAEIVKQLEAKPEEQTTPDKVTLPEIPPSNLPMIEDGETVHDAAPMAESDKLPVPEPVLPPLTSALSQSAKAEAPKPAAQKYEGRVDPYREPIE